MFRSSWWVFSGVDHVTFCEATALKSRLRQLLIAKDRFVGTKTYLISLTTSKVFLPYELYQNFCIMLTFNNFNMRLF